jgi:hypothetical protein
MLELVQVVPNVDLLLSLEPEELAVKMLFLIRQRRENMFHPDNMKNEVWGDVSRGH